VRRRIRVAIVGSVFAIGASATVSGPARAADEAGSDAGGVTFSLATPLAASGDVTVGTQYGSYKRAVFRQNLDGSGYYFQVYGSGDCTASTTDVDDQISDMADYAWDNAASYAKDWGSCHTKIYRYANFDTALTGYVDYGSTGSSLGANDNLTSSFKVS
jgi:hypothetical protein